MAQRTYIIKKERSTDLQDSASVGAPLLPPLLQTLDVYMDSVSETRANREVQKVEKIKKGKRGKKRNQGFSKSAAPTFPENISARPQSRASANGGRVGDKNPKRDHTSFFADSSGFPGSEDDFSRLFNTETHLPDNSSISSSSMPPEHDGDGDTHSQPSQSQKQSVSQSQAQTKSHQSPPQHSQQSINDRYVAAPPPGFAQSPSPRKQGTKPSPHKRTIMKPIAQQQPGPAGAIFKSQDTSVLGQVIITGSWRSPF